jgi:capsid protein
MNKQNKLDRFISQLFPAWGLQRTKSRARSDYYQAVRHATDAIRTSTKTRLDRPWPGSFSETGQRPLKEATHEQLRDRSRYADRNFWLASRLLNASRAHVLGSGTTIKPTTTDADFNREATKRWRKYWNGAVSPEMRGLWTGPSFERHVYRSMLLDGDVGIFMSRTGKLQLISSEYIVTPNKRQIQEAGGNEEATIVEGVEINPNQGNAINAFWIYGTSNGTTVFQRVPTGRFIYLPRIKQSDDVRGMPVFGLSLSLFDQVDGFVESTVLAAHMATMFGLLFKEQQGMHFANTLPQGDDAQGNARPLIDLEPGMVKRLGPMDDVVQVKPEHPTTQFGDFVDKICAFAALELDLPKEVVLLSFTASYSASRAALITAQRPAKAVHEEFTSRCISRIYRWFISRQIKSSFDPLTPPADNDQWEHTAQQQPWDYLDPVKDREGELMGIAGGLESQRSVHSKRGGDIDKWRIEEKEDRLQNKEAGLTTAHLSRMVYEENSNGQSEEQD